MPADPALESGGPTPKPRRSRRKFKIVLGIVAVAVLALIAIPNFVKARSTECKNSCVNILRQIDGAKEQWALEASKNPGDPPDEAAIARYIKGGEMPTCPLDKRPYQVGNVGELPRCSVPGHSLQ